MDFLSYLNEDEIRKLLGNINNERFIEIINNINSKETKNKLQKEIDNAIGVGVDGTPTLRIKDRSYHGAKPYYELKRIILED